MTSPDLRNCAQVKSFTQSLETNSRAVSLSISIGANSLAIRNFAFQLRFEKRNAFGRDGSERIWDVIWPATIPA
jgi:hypothetical protein